MGVSGCISTWRGGGIRNDRCAPTGEPCVAHVQFRPGNGADARKGKRFVKTAFDSVAATVKAGKIAVSVAQGAQGRCDARLGLPQTTRHAVFGGFQRLCGPVQQTKHAKQVFGVTGFDSALRIDIGVALCRESVQGGINQIRHPLQ